MEEVKTEGDTDGSGEIEFEEFLSIMSSGKLRQMQSLDDREARLRTALEAIQGAGGRVHRRDFTRLVVVRTWNENIYK